MISPGVPSLGGVALLVAGYTARRPTMTLKRLRPIAKLALLFGTPLAIVFGLFGAGVYCGVENQASIAAFERNWLGLEGPKFTGGVRTAVDDTASASPSDAGAGASPPSPAETERRAPLPLPPPVAPPPLEDPPNLDGGDTAVLDAASESLTPELVQTHPDPLEGEHADLLGMPVVISVKVLVDPRWIEVQPDWIDDVQRTLGEASQVYAKQFGIILELHAVGRWPVASEGMSPAALLEDLKTHPREGADILLGVSATPSPSAEADAWHRAPISPEATHNRAYGLVYALPKGGRRPHLRPLLREVSSMLGAVGIPDPAHPDYRAGSWMSDAAVGPAQAPWIDVANRMRVLERKVRPFAPEDALAERTSDGSEE